MTDEGSIHLPPLAVYPVISTCDLQILPACIPKYMPRVSRETDRRNGRENGGLTPAVWLCSRSHQGFTIDITGTVRYLAATRLTS